MSWGTGQERAAADGRAAARGAPFGDDQAPEALVGAVGEDELHVVEGEQRRLALLERRIPVGGALDELEAEVLRELRHSDRGVAARCAIHNGGEARAAAALAGAEVTPSSVAPKPHARSPSLQPIL